MKPKYDNFEMNKITQDLMSVMNKITLILSRLASISMLSFMALSLSANATSAKSEASEAPDPSANEKQLINIIMRPEIVGLWGMEIPNNKSCVEFYNFRNANDVLINSGKEWSFAQYEYRPSVDPKQLSALALQIRFDNNQVDCSGHQQDQTGEVAQYFVRWKDINNIQFCASEKGDQCVANLKRILP